MSDKTVNELIEAEACGVWIAQMKEMLDNDNDESPK
jgi:hypothetical protein